MRSTLFSAGHLTDLARFLGSATDRTSPRTRLDLVEKKVNRLVVMAQLFGKDGCNVKFDIPSAQKVIAKWPTPIIWSPLGRSVISETGKDSIDGCYFKRIE